MVHLSWHYKSVSNPFTHIYQNVLSDLNTRHHILLVIIYHFKPIQKDKLHISAVFIYIALRTVFQNYALVKIPAIIFISLFSKQKLINYNC